LVAIIAMKSKPKIIWEGHYWVFILHGRVGLEAVEQCCL